MAFSEDREEIKASLDVFVGETQTRTLRIPANDDGPLVILYGRTKLGVPRSHPKLREIEAGRKESTEFKECETLLRATLKDRVLFRTTIHMSNLSNCTLVSCTIYGGKIETSHLSDCRIRNAAFGASEVSKTPFISCCHIAGGAAYDAEIFNSTLRGVDPVQSCDIESCLVVNSVGRHSALTGCGVSETELRNCKVFDGLLTDTVIQSKTWSNLRDFPVEIRKMIYKDVIASDGVSAGLIAALRSEPILYGEILETLFREHRFVLSKQNLDAFGNTALTTLQRVTKIALQGRDVIATDNVSIYFPSKTRITDIQVEYHGSLVNIHHFYNVTKLWFKYFGTVRKFTVMWSEAWNPKNHRAVLATPEPPRTLKGAIGVANKRLNAEAVLVKAAGEIKKQDATFSGEGKLHRSSMTDGPRLEIYMWTWEADEGKVLAWDSS